MSLLEEATLPVPKAPVTPGLEPFWAALAEGELKLPFSRVTGELVWYPRAADARGPADLEWRTASGRGVVYSVTVVRRPAGEYRDSGPYALAYVTLEEGVRVLTHVIGIPPEEVRIGMPVRAVVAEGADTPERDPEQGELAKGPTVGPLLFERQPRHLGSPRVKSDDTGETARLPVPVRRGRQLAGEEPRVEHSLDGTQCDKVGPENGDLVGSDDPRDQPPSRYRDDHVTLANLYHRKGRQLRMSGRCPVQHVFHGHHRWRCRHGTIGRFVPTRAGRSENLHIAGPRELRHRRHGRPVTPLVDGEVGNERGQVSEQLHQFAPRIGQAPGRIGRPVIGCATNRADIDVVIQEIDDRNGAPGLIRHPAGIVGVQPRADRGHRKVTEPRSRAVRAREGARVNEQYMRRCRLPGHRLPQHPQVQRHGVSGCGPGGQRDHRSQRASA